MKNGLAIKVILDKVYSMPGLPQPSCVTLDVSPNS